MLKKGNKIIIAIVAIVVFIVIGSIGKSNNEVKVIINKAKEYLNNGEISEAENVLRDKAGETNNREFKKLWSIAYGYEQVSNKFNLYDNIEWAEEMLDKIDKSYKEYEPTREKIDNLKEELSDVKNTREEFKEKIDGVQRLIDEGSYEEAMELSKETPEWQKVSQKDKNTMMDLELQVRQLFYAERTESIKEEQKKKEEEEQLKNEKEEKEKIENQENNFSKEVAQKIIDNLNSNNGNSRNFYEITSDLKIDDNGKKYFEVVAKDKDWIKFDDHTILAHYRLYSNEELIETQN
ncbi:MAG: hypothetical protein E6876_15605 [Clostridium sp.]|uniref:hypothetical protein n=1 Tax=Clostridium tertium TaxID=1559 RepID=UPI0022E79309|nr:hypothetical protein [Clostridium tertium]MDU1568630.1 hypothetical protein [Clostridium sp.]